MARPNQRRHADPAESTPFVLLAGYADISQRPEY